MAKTGYDEVSLKVVCERINDLANGGLIREVTPLVNRARGQTREFIENTHPQVAFGGKNLIEDNYNNKTHHQTVLGHFGVSNGNVVSGNVYANYFQRWYNTGAQSHPIAYGKYKNRMSTQYYPRGYFYVYNKNAIENNFAQNLNSELDKMKLL